VILVVTFVTLDDLTECQPEFENGQFCKTMIALENWNVANVADYAIVTRKCWVIMLLPQWSTESFSNNQIRLKLWSHDASKKLQFSASHHEHYTCRLTCGNYHLLFLWERVNFAPPKLQYYSIKNVIELLSLWAKGNCQIWLRSVLWRHLLVWVKCTVSSFSICSSCFINLPTDHNSDLAQNMRFGTKRDLASIWRTNAQKLPRRFARKLHYRANINVCGRVKTKLLWNTNMKSDRSLRTCYLKLSNGGITLTSFPCGKRTSLSRKSCVADDELDNNCEILIEWPGQPSKNVLSEKVTAQSEELIENTFLFMNAFSGVIESPAKTEFINFSDSVALAGMYFQV